MGWGSEIRKKLIPGLNPGVTGQKQHRILDPDAQHCIYPLQNYLSEQREGRVKSSNDSKKPGISIPYRGLFLFCPWFVNIFL
jgi:hypothetical protein